MNSFETLSEDERAVVLRMPPAFWTMSAADQEKEIKESIGRAVDVNKLELYKKLIGEKLPDGVKVKVFKGKKRAMQDFINQVGRARGELAIEEARKVVLESEFVQQEKMKLSLFEESVNDRLSEDFSKELDKKRPNLEYLLDVMIAMNANKE